MNEKQEKELRELHRLNCHGGLMGVDSFISLIPQIQQILSSDSVSEVIVPEWRDLSGEKEYSKLEKFIFEYDDADNERSIKFRNDLKEVIQEALQSKSDSALVEETAFDLNALLEKCNKNQFYIIRADEVREILGKLVSKKHKCNSCKFSVPTCGANKVIYSIDVDKFLHGADADKVLLCDTYQFREGVEK